MTSAGAEGIISRYFHTEALGDAGYIATHVTKCQDTQLLTLQLTASLAIVEITNGKYQQANTNSATALEF